MLLQQAAAVDINHAAGDKPIFHGQHVPGRYFFGPSNPTHRQRVSCRGEQGVALFGGQRRISCGRNVLLGWLDDFKLEHPNIRLQLLLNDSNADLFRETIDIALRFGVPRDSSLVALPIVPLHQRVACASPDIKAGRLVRLFDDWQGEPTPFNLMCPHRVQVSERVKVLQGFLQVRCQALLNDQ